MSCFVAKKKKKKFIHAILSYYLCNANFIWETLVRNNLNSWSDYHHVNNLNTCKRMIVYYVETVYKLKADTMMMKYMYSRLFDI